MIDSVYFLPDRNTRWNEWCVPLSVNHVTLGEILESASHMSAGQEDIPFVVQLFENPKYRLPFLKIFNGAADIDTHDCIHALLGRGLLAKDEAFVLGFTMGSTRKLSRFSEIMFAFATRYLYPGPYKFSLDEIQVYRDALKLGEISGCQALNRVDYSRFMNWDIQRLRKKLGIPTDLLKAYYRIEIQRYPKDKASKRLLL